MGFIYTFWIFYQLCSRVTILVELSTELVIFKSFHIRFKNVLISCVNSKIFAVFAPISFDVQRNGNSNDNIQSFDMSLELPFYLQIELEPNIQDQNENETILLCLTTYEIVEGLHLGLHPTKSWMVSPEHIKFKNTVEKHNMGR